MCGLVGWISNEKSLDALERKKYFEQALIMDTVRGGDATGCFVVKRDWGAKEAPWADWAKQAVGGHEFVIGSDFQDLFKNGKTNDYKFCVGHNRSATIGGTDVDAAHPFIHGPITLVHNGTVNHGEVAKKRVKDKLINDSETICHMLAEDTPENVVKQLDGAFALIWHDLRDDSLNFIRNQERPMSMAKAMGYDTIYFASEPEMLYWLGNRLKLKLQDIVSLRAAHWLKFRGPKLMVPEVKELELYKPPKAHGSYNWQAQEWTQTKHTPGLTPTGTTPQASTSSQTSHPPGGTKITKSDGFGVPEQVQEDLLEYDLYVDQMEEFLPTQGQPIKWKAGENQETYSVLGWLRKKRYGAGGDGELIPCILHGLSKQAWELCGHRVWTVRPLGVTKFGWQLPVIVARLIRTQDLGLQLTTIADDKRPPIIDEKTEWVRKRQPALAKIDVPDYSAQLDKANKEAAAVAAAYDGFEDDGGTLSSAMQDDDIMYEGPNKLMLTRSDWYKATQGGCISCGKLLTLTEHANKLTWVNDGHDPMCEACDAEEIDGWEEQELADPDEQIIPPGTDEKEFAQ